MLQTGSTSATGSDVCFGGPSPSSVDTLGVRNQQPPRRNHRRRLQAAAVFAAATLLALAFVALDWRHGVAIIGGLQLEDGDGAPLRQQDDAASHRLLSEAAAPPPAANQTMSPADIISLSAFMFVIGGSVLSVLVVYLFIHRSNALTAIPCFKCLRS